MRPTLADVLAGRVPDGVHGWTPPPGLDLAGACAGTGWRLARLPGAATKPELLEALIAGLGLPSWTGRNWDALEEALGDLEAGRYLVVWEDPGAGEPRAVEQLSELLADVTQEWAARDGRFVVLRSG